MTSIPLPSIRIPLRLDRGWFWFAWKRQGNKVCVTSFPCLSQPCYHIADAETLFIFCIPDMVFPNKTCTQNFSKRKERLNLNVIETLCYDVGESHLFLDRSAISSSLWKVLLCSRVMEKKQLFAQLSMHLTLRNN